MMKKLYTVLLATILLSTSAHAYDVESVQPAPQPAQRAGDHWGDRHVAYHFGGEMAVGFLAGALIDNKAVAIGACMVPGIVREQWKQDHGYASYHASRIVADAAGCAMGVYTEHWIVGPNAVFFSHKF
jgi:hypothetical protein